MLVMRAVKHQANSVGKLVCSEQSARFDHLALGMHPLRLDCVQPRALFGEQAAHDPHSLARLFGPAVVLTEPAPHLFGDVPACFESQMRTMTFFPRAWSFSQHHERKRLVMEETGLPSTNLSHVCSIPGR
jgi:hypothetical protein